MNIANWKNKITVNAAPAAAPAAAFFSGPTAQGLLDAAARFTAQGNADKAATCRDIGIKVQRYGFASDKQREFAAKLIAWSQPTALRPDIAPLVADLNDVAQAYKARGDMRSYDTCCDLAAKLARFGSFASDKQESFARSLIAKVAPAAAAPADTQPARTYARFDNQFPASKLFDVMQNHSTLHVGDLKISRKNQETWSWVIWQDVCVGKLADGVATLWFSKVKSDKSALIVLINEIESDPLAAAQKYGKLSGRCCSCGRDLTDPESIERGIGPICAEKFA